MSALVTRLLAMAAGDEHGAAAPFRSLDPRTPGSGATASSRIGVAASRHSGRAPDDVAQIIDTLLDNASAYAPGTGRGLDRSARRIGRGSRFVTTARGCPGGRGRGDRAVLSAPDAPPGGSGLGLAIVRELAEADGGSKCRSIPPRTAVPDRGPLSTSVSRGLARVRYGARCDGPSRCSRGASSARRSPPL